MSSDRFDSDGNESPRQTLYALEREEEVVLNAKKELEKLLEEVDEQNLSTDQDIEEEFAKWNQKVKNLKAQLQELEQVDDYQLASLSSSIDAVEREIQQEKCNSEVVTNEAGAKEDQLELEINQLESKEQELASHEQTIISKIAEAENRLTLERVGYEEDKLALRLLKENMDQLKTEIEELTLEKTTLNMEMMSRLSKVDTYERGNGLFVEIVDWKAGQTEKISQLKIKLEEATIELEAKKAELQRKRESKVGSNVIIQLDEALRESFGMQISDLKDEISKLLYKFDLPSCEFVDSSSKDYEWVRVYLDEASKKEAKMFLECERLSGVILELTEAVACLEEDIYKLNS